MNIFSASKEIRLTTRTMGRLLTMIIFVLGIFFSLNGCDREGCREEKDPDCVCTMEYAPVCGCNGKTYGNACEAECYGIHKYTRGECK